MAMFSKILSFGLCLVGFLLILFAVPFSQLGDDEIGFQVGC